MNRPYTEKIRQISTKNDFEFESSEYEWRNAENSQNGTVMEEIAKQGKTKGRDYKVSKLSRFRQNDFVNAQCSSKEDTEGR